MKTPRIVKAIGHIDDDLINSATKSKKVSKKNIWIKWTSLAASFALIIFVSAVVVPTLFGDGNVSLPIGVGETTVNGEITNSIIDNNSPVTSPTENKDAPHIDKGKPTDVVNDNTTLPAKNDITSVSNNEKPSHATGDKDEPNDMLGHVVIDGAVYLQRNDDAERYTRDICLGSASDYEGTYQTYFKDVAGNLYTTKEDSDILIVELVNGGSVVLGKLKGQNEF
ncbi:MAG: hypothetical protein J6L89_05800 [Clostridia bacterium]|nr:hypothetical protein [Clostridia bacterium]